MTSAEIFGSHVLDLLTFKKRLPKPTYHALRDAIQKGIQLDGASADTIAQAMMEWAVSKGVTHYTHWFQPMTGNSAQKHDAFLSFDANMMPIERFSGNQLIQSEPDASSFPSGGTRTTFEARGYTAWDPSSPVFIQRNRTVSILCIPSVFFTYTGHALDTKTPLLRSINQLNEAAAAALELLTGKKVSVSATLGCEQEYFLVDRKWHDMRPDLIMAGRTVLGALPAKGQQMEDHYFGAIKGRVLAFMEDLETQLYELGVPAKTRHNEVAPHQFEMAPIFRDANLAADNNQLVMEVARKVAHEHDLSILLHEKPFAGVNGSGKHLNWSMATSDGRNLLEPGKSPQSNITFLYFLVAVVNAIQNRGDLLRATIASAGNDHRLGANEAPPAIMSVFLGSQLTNILDQIEKADGFNEEIVASIDLGLAELPNITVDRTDRNRTSPFAFTGNKFEFRACGSSQSVSFPVSALNAAVTESLLEMNAKLEDVGQITEKNLFELLRPFISQSKNIRFEGDNYSDEWAAEAEERGLTNLKTTPEALALWQTEEAKAFAKNTGFLTDFELEAVINVRMEQYAKHLDIEAATMLRLIDNFVLPAAIAHQGESAASLSALTEALGEKAAASSALQAGRLHCLAETIGNLIDARNKLETELDAVHQLPEEAHALATAKQVVPLMDKARAQADALETMVDASTWELPTYHELLFLM
ncbi:glutamine synthetase III family protein [Acanthopleuribacter pedis]|uniref:Glutamine synthetase III n=1 Tax=Acanthopleuribacter pedis TaxID=442870 RepID=A0A8J7Q271_9BACT|nr:glutamine synthetase III [Acanthopleuribacter pedis]MBO1319147.1 glutamine synthetase III [Acanthopleuribacter pedis]